ncbi:MAG: glycerophosphodiester phosphodiesterase [Ruminococcus sp.]|nr:glycerophosphodiester phosphodiesterase [Ruminococcus sp.]
MDFGKYIAHRGLHNQHIPENSMTAFRRAAENGFAIELDVRLTKDGKVAVVHDKTLKRLCGMDKLVKDCTYEELSHMRLYGTEERIPLFKDVLAMIDGRVPLLIEIKDGAPLGVLEKRTYHLLRQYKGKYAVQSFNPMSMMWFRFFAPEVERGLLISGHNTGLRIEHLARRISCRPGSWRLLSDPHFISADLLGISDKFMEDIKNCGRQLALWTVSAKEHYEKAFGLGDIVIFENFDEHFHDYSDNRPLRHAHGV